MGSEISLNSQIEGIVVDTLRTADENYLHGYDGEPAWGDPLVGFATGDDPLFQFLKNHIGGFYRTPEEVFAATFGDDSVSAGDLSVVAWVLPQTAATKRDQRAESKRPSVRWMTSRAYWPELSKELHDGVVAALGGLGLRALAPEMSPLWQEADSPRYGRASTWSQRHTAFVAGLGTFGLSDGLITRVGKAMRAGSVIVETRLDATPRDYEGHLDWCAYYADGSCGDCIRRCPARAITVEGHDKERCNVYLRRVVETYANEFVGERTPGCGLCQSDVQCESGLPDSIVT